MANMERVFSGVQPSGSIHIGNYLGAIRNWVALQDNHDNECIFCVVDQHAITTPQDPAQLRRNVVETAAAFFACGVNPERSLIFRQSAVPQHSQLMWVLAATATRMGWLNRMTQFKAKAGVPAGERLVRIMELAEKVQKGVFASDEDALEEFENTQSEGIGLGLYVYPVLMAADILLYKTVKVPVGEDQRQHLQLARQIATAFNHRYGDVFVEPRELIAGEATRIMSLRYPDRKMSKSAAESDEELIYLTDSADIIAKKIKRATSDTDLLPSEYEGLHGRAGAENLLRIYAALRQITVQQACNEFGGKGFGDLKKSLTDALVQEIVPIGKRLNHLLADQITVTGTLERGRHRAEAIARTTLQDVYNAVGLN